MNPARGTLVGVLVAVLTVCSAFGPSMASVTESSSGLPADFRSYDNPMYGITITYPDDWSALPVQDPYWFIEFYPSSTADDDTFAEYVAVGAERVYPNTPPASYVDLYVETLQTDDVNFQLLESSEIEVDGKAAHRIVYTTISYSEPLVQGVVYKPSQYQSDVKAKVMEVSLIENEIAYTITYAAEETKYDVYLPTVQKMIQSSTIDTRTTVNNSAVKGAYRNTEAGLSIAFPDGWAGYESTNDDRIKPIYPFSTMVVMRPSVSAETNRGQYISLFISNGSKLQEEASKIEGYSPCITPDTSIVRFSDVKLLESVSECTYFGISSSEITYTAFTPERLIFLAYSGTDENSFNDGLEAFRNAAETLHVKNALDLSDLHLISNYSGSDYQTYEVVIDQQPYEIAVSTTSQISKFDFSDEKAQINFTIEEAQQWGVTEIELGHVLVGPFVVMIDGQVSNTTSLINDLTSNNPTSLSFEHLKGTHEVSVIGTRVIPEFHIMSSLAIISILLGTVVLSGRIHPR